MLNFQPFYAEDGSEPASRVRLKRGSEIAPENVEWCWNGWLAKGKLNLLGGAPGTGKTTIALRMAATITTGGKWPDGSKCQAGNAIIWSGEDEAADTLVPRLMAMGANMDRVFFVEGVDDRGEDRAFDPAKDIPSLEAAIKEAGGAAFIVVDPIVSAVAANSHKNGETRRALQPLVELASKCRAALLGITHFSKGTSGREPLERITGSVAFGALPRVVMIAAKETQPGCDASPRRIFARAKANNGPDDGGFSYTLRQTLLPDAPIEASIVEWGEMIEGNARDMLADVEADETERHSDGEKGEAEDFLIDVLAAGPITATEVYRQAEEAGIKHRTLERAKQSLKVKSKRRIEPGHSAHWAWHLPENSNSAKDANIANIAKKTGLENLATLQAVGPEMVSEPL